MLSDHDFSEAEYESHILFQVSQKIRPGPSQNAEREGPVAEIQHLLERIKQLQKEVDILKNKLKLYETDFGI